MSRRQEIGTSLADPHERDETLIDTKLVPINQSMKLIVASALVYVLAGCALTMTNTFDVIGERGQTGEAVVSTNQGTAAVPMTEFHYDMENNFFYALEFKSRINEAGHMEAGHAVVALDDLTGQWQPTTAIMGGEPVDVEASLNTTAEGEYEVQVRRNYCRWYAYPADVAAIVVAPVDLAKNITINAGLLSLLMVASLFMDVGFIAPTGGAGL